jgi:hypothetical protein
VAQDACQSIQTPDHQHIALAGNLHRVCEGGIIGLTMLAGLTERWSGWSARTGGHISIHKLPLRCTAQFCSGFAGHAACPDQFARCGGWRSNRYKHTTGARSLERARNS